jgi:putative FmdB family regulatory protein
MPIFEYACRDCGSQFEYLTREGRSPECPSCASDQLEKQLSTFAVNANGAAAKAHAPAFGPCGSCGDPRGPGSCSMN